MSEEIKIDGIPIQDYGTPNSRSCYPGEINTGKTIKNNIDYWKYLYFGEKEKNKELEEKLKVAKQLYNDSCIRIATECVEKDKIKDKIDWYKTQQIKYSELDMLKDVVITNQKITLLESLLKGE